MAHVYMHPVVPLIHPHMVHVPPSGEGEGRGEEKKEGEDGREGGRGGGEEGDERK